jgi:hypothetical protein
MLPGGALPPYQDPRDSYPSGKVPGERMAMAGAGRIPRVPRVMPYTEAETALGGISRSTLQRLIRKGELDKIEVAGSPRLLTASVEAYLRRQMKARGDRDR